MMKKKRCGFIVFVIESAAASRGIPNKYVGKLFHTPLERTFIPGVVFQKRLQLCITTPWHLCKRFGLGPVVIWPQSTSTTYYSWVEIYTHPRISQRDFPVMRFVQHKSTETKIKNTSWQAHEWADRQHHKARHA